MRCLSEDLYELCSDKSMQLDKEAKRIALGVDRYNTKYLLPQKKTYRTVDNHNFENVDNFVYIATSINNSVNPEIQRRIFPVTCWC